MHRKWSTLKGLKANFSTFFNQITEKPLFFECELCLEPDNSRLGICDECAARLPFSGLCCPQCSEPVITEGRCGACQRKPPDFDYSSCSLMYTHPLTHWIHRCKDRNDTRQIPRFTALMQQAPPLFSLSPDIVTCIPASRRRLLSRGFNLSAELAAPVADYLELPFIPGLLSKTRHTEKRGASAKERSSNPTGLSYGPVSPRGQHILIVDDVMTTGSTLNEAAAILKQQGAITVGAWCLARTPKTR